MKPRGLLMIEHRLIERMISIIQHELDRIRDASRVDTVFMLIYADRTHHGKEEDILFRALREKDMNSRDKQLMNELTDEHQRARELTAGLVEANEKYCAGRIENLEIIAQNLNELLDLYPGHIRKEDSEFFPNAEKYFNEQELSAMLTEFYDFDMHMIHEKYRKVIEEQEKVYV